MINYFDLLLPSYSDPYFGGDFSLFHFSLCKSTLFGYITLENHTKVKKKEGEPEQGSVEMAATKWLVAPSCETLIEPISSHIPSQRSREHFSTGSHLLRVKSSATIQTPFHRYFCTNSLQISKQASHSVVVSTIKNDLFIRQASRVFLIKIFFYCLRHVHLILLT